MQLFFITGVILTHPGTTDPLSATAYEVTTPSHRQRRHDYGDGAIAG